MVTKEQFERFVKVQESGVCNMLSPKVCVLACIPMDVHIEILNNYDKLAEQYGGAFDETHK